MSSSGTSPKSISDGDQRSSQERSSSEEGSSPPQWLAEEDGASKVKKLSDETWYQPGRSGDTEAQMSRKTTDSPEDEALEDFFTPYSPVDEFFDDLLLDDIIDSDGGGQESLMGSIELRGTPQTVQWKETATSGEQPDAHDVAETLFSFSSANAQPTSTTPPPSSHANSKNDPSRNMNTNAIPVGQHQWKVMEPATVPSQQQQQQEERQRLRLQHHHQLQKEHHERQHQQHRVCDRIGLDQHVSDPSYTPSSASSRQEQFDRKTKQSASERRVDFYRAELKRQTNNKAKASHFKVGEVRSRSPYFLSFVWREFINKLYGIFIPVFKDPETGLVDTPAALQGKIRKNRMPWKNLDIEKALRQAMDEHVKKQGPAPGTRRYRGDF